MSKKNDSAHTVLVALVVPAFINANPGEVHEILGEKVKFTEEFSTNGLAPATHFGAVAEMDEELYMAYRNNGATKFGEHVDEARRLAKQDQLHSATQFKNNVLISEPGVELKIFAYTSGLVPVGASEKGAVAPTDEEVAQVKADADQREKDAQKAADEADKQAKAEAKAAENAEAEAEKARKEQANAPKPPAK